MGTALAVLPELWHRTKLPARPVRCHAPSTIACTPTSAAHTGLCGRGAVWASPVQFGRQASHRIATVLRGRWRVCHLCAAFVLAALFRPRWEMIGNGTLRDTTSGLCAKARLPASCVHFGEGHTWLRFHICLLMLCFASRQSQGMVGRLRGLAQAGMAVNLCCLCCCCGGSDHHSKCSLSMALHVLLCLGLRGSASHSARYQHGWCPAVEH